MSATPLEDIPKIREELRATFLSGKTKPIEYRRDQLIQLGYLLQDNAQRFRDTLASDLGRPPLEADFLEINATLTEVGEAIKNVYKWTKPERLPFSFNWFAMRPTIRKEPKGVVLIISPFNFPILLILGPLSGAIAAGNCTVLKPSELAPATAALITELVPKYLDPDFVRVVNGAVPETTKLLELHWDHILYTGSNRVAKVISAAAAKHLTPVTHELGGKNPVFIDKTADLKLAARRILWAKTACCGQVCVAPDYALVTKEVQDDFIKELQQVYASFYPNGDPSTSSDFGRIISTAHANRIKKLLDDTKGEVVFGGDSDPEKKYVAPTVVKNVGLEDSLMSEEIFGPVLPIITVEDIEEGISYVNARDHPLALYVFSNDDKVKQQIFDNTQSGACVANELVIHSGATGLPFGGIGPSGSGMTRGKFNFDTFTHLRSTLDGKGWIDKLILGARFPPYTDANHKFLNNLTKVKLPPRPKSTSGLKTLKSRWGLWFIYTVLGLVSAVLIKRGLVLGGVSIPLLRR